MPASKAKPRTATLKKKAPKKATKSTKPHVAPKTSWSKDAPKRGAEREELAHGCGERCFLMPSQRKFPICSRCGSGGVCSCAPSCAGLRAAMIRSAQWGYDGVHTKAKRMYAKQGCSAAAAKHKQRSR